jgi:hypothetical protein
MAKIQGISNSSVAACNQKRLAATANTKLNNPKSIQGLKMPKVASK